MRKRILSLILSLILLSSILGGCRTASSNANNGASKYSTFISVDVYDTLANYQGIQSGWFAEIVKDKFNMELNIIAPNVSGNGDNLYETRFAAGDIGDLIICSSTSGKLQELMNAGLIINMNKYLQGKSIVSKYSDAIRTLNDTISPNAIYAIPGEISKMPANSSSEALCPIYGSYLRWDYYKELGYPKVSTLEDLLPIIKQMQENHPYADNGDPTYGFSLFDDWDGNLMNAIKQPCCFYGYDEYGFVLSKADGSDFQNILDPESLYMRVLNFYFEANQLGLIDPDSEFNAYSDVFDKFSNGQILFGPWPWLAQSAYNNLDNLSDGKGYYFVPIEDELIYSYGCKNTGNVNKVIAIGCNAEDPARLADFIDWLYSPEGIQISCAQTHQGTAGPEGLTWEIAEDGPKLTDFGIEALINGNAKVPDSWGGGYWIDGICQLNYSPVSEIEVDENGYSYYYSQWPSVLKLSESDLEADWSEYMGVSSVMEYLKNNDQLIVSPGTDYTAYKETTELATIRTQCASLIVSYSWDMVFAADKEEFDTLYAALLKKTNALGYKDVLEYDMDNAKQEAQAKEALIKND